LRRWCLLSWIFTVLKLPCILITMYECLVTFRSPSLPVLISIPVIPRNYHIRLMNSMRNSRYTDMSDWGGRTGWNLVCRNSRIVWLKCWCIKCNILYSWYTEGKFYSLSYNTKLVAELCNYLSWQRNHDLHGNIGGSRRKSKKDVWHEIVNLKDEAKTRLALKSELKQKKY
jgi:hypothetical protein